MVLKTVWCYASRRTAQQWMSCTLPLLSASSECRPVRLFNANKPLHLQASLRFCSAAVPKKSSVIVQKDHCNVGTIGRFYFP
ncbi:hypothetical protein FHG87_010486 [Trinorchestia longiramus]|nr:hypothetical protein FHG87_010486 [Trinorchestia longiramus]